MDGRCVTRESARGIHDADRGCHVERVAPHFPTAYDRVVDRRRGDGSMEGKR
jgi:hypothetical protein